jgi:SPP1 family predicted phage head-tail adaptor
MSSALRISKGARRFNERITLAHREAYRDDFGHASIGEPVPVLDVYAEVRQTTASRTLVTYQQADEVNVSIEFRTPSAALDYNCIIWRGHVVEFSHPEDVDGRGRYTRIAGTYQVDAPVQGPKPVTT